MTLSADDNDGTATFVAYDPEGDPLCVIKARSRPHAAARATRTVALQAGESVADEWDDDGWPGPDHLDRIDSDVYVID